MEPRLSTGPRPERQCQIEPSWHAADAHEVAMDRLIGRDTAAIAREVGLKRRTVQSWRDRDGEHRGPGRLLAQTIRAALAYGREVDDALAPVAVIADEHGFDLARRCAEAGAGDVVVGLTDAMAKFGETVSEVSAAARDGRITPAEVPGIERGITKSIQQLHQLLQTVQAAARGGRVVEIGRP